MIPQESYERYLERYCRKHGISRQEAEQHTLVQEIKKYYYSNDTSVKAVGWKEENT